MKLLNKIPYRYVIGGVIAIMVIAIIFLTCNGNKKKNVIVLNPTQAEIDHASEQKRQHDIFIDSVNKKISALQKAKDSLKSVVAKKDAEISIKSLRITALTKQATGAKNSNNHVLFDQSCDSLIPQVNDLVEAVDVLQQDNRNLQDAYDSLYGTSSLKISRLEYDYTVAQENYKRVLGIGGELATQLQRSGKKAEKKIVIGPQVGGTYSLQGRWIPYVGIGVTYRLIRL